MSLAFLTVPEDFSREALCKDFFSFVLWRLETNQSAANRIKILKRLILSYGRPFFLREYCDNQFRFRPASSTTCGLISLHHQITKCLDDKYMYVRMLLMSLFLRFIFRRRSIDYSTVLFLIVYMRVGCLHNSYLGLRTTFTTGSTTWKLVQHTQFSGWNYLRKIARLSWFLSSFNWWLDL